MKNIFAFFMFTLGVIPFCDGNCMINSRREIDRIEDNNQHVASVGTTYRLVGSEFLVQYVKCFVASGGGRYDYMLISDSRIIDVPDLHINDVLQFVVDNNGQQRQSGKDVLLVNQFPRFTEDLPVVYRRNYAEAPASF